MSPAKLIYNYWFGDVTIYAYLANLAEGLAMHNHEYKHLVICATGKIQVKDGDNILELVSTDRPYELVAQQNHEITALEDGTVFINVVYNKDVRQGADRDPRIEIINGIPIVRY